ncbi:MAG: HupE/UreJ family protein, partial [Sphingomonadaceae bacterium]
NRLDLRRGGLRCGLSAAGLTSRVRAGEKYLSLELTGVCPRNGSIGVTTGLYFGSLGYTALLEVRNSRGFQTGVMSMGSPSWSEPREQSGLPTLLRFLKEGVWHVLIGYDHIAFLLLLMLPSVLRNAGTGWRAAVDVREAIGDLVKIVSLFTISHSTTLGLVSTGLVSVPSQPVEITIAGSIVVAGLLNLSPAALRWRLPVAFVFGLIHGFGFAGVLQVLDDSGARILPMLAGFNIGIEIAQLLIVALALPGLWLLSRGPQYARRVMPALSLATAAIGAFWLVGRL